MIKYLENNKHSAISSEELAAAILSSKTIKEAAEKVHLSTKTVYAKMATMDFQVAYNQAKAEVLRNTITSINNNMLEAVNVIAEVMRDKKANPATRLQAAQTILSGANKLNSYLMDYEYRALAGVRGGFWSDQQEKEINKLKE